MDAPSPRAGDDGRCGKGIARGFFLVGWLFARSGCQAQQNELNSLKKHAEEAGARASS